MIMGRLGNNLSGQSKRCIGMALQIGIANIAGIIASLIYRTQDSPRYLVGRTSPLLFPRLTSKFLPHIADGISITFVAIGLWIVPIAVVAYQRVNQKREGILRDMRERGQRLSPEETRSLGDRSLTFRYMI